MIFYCYDGKSVLNSMSIWNEYLRASDNTCVKLELQGWREIFLGPLKMAPVNSFCIFCRLCFVPQLNHLDSGRNPTVVERCSFSSLTRRKSRRMRSLETEQSLGCF